MEKLSKKNQKKIQILDNLLYLIFKHSNLPEVYNESQMEDGIQQFFQQDTEEVQDHVPSQENSLFLNFARSEIDFRSIKYWSTRDSDASDPLAIETVQIIHSYQQFLDLITTKFNVNKLPKDLKEYIIGFKKLLALRISLIKVFTEIQEISPTGNARDILILLQKENEDKLDKVQFKQYPGTDLFKFILKNELKCLEELLQTHMKIDNHEFIGCFFSLTKLKLLHDNWKQEMFDFKISTNTYQEFTFTYNFYVILRSKMFFFFGNFLPSEPQIPQQLKSKYLFEKHQLLNEEVLRRCLEHLHSKYEDIHTQIFGNFEEIYLNFVEYVKTYPFFVQMDFFRTRIQITQQEMNKKHQGKYLVFFDKSNIQGENKEEIIGLIIHKELQLFEASQDFMEKYASKSKNGQIKDHNNKTLIINTWLIRLSKYWYFTLTSLGGKNSKHENLFSECKNILEKWRCQGVYNFDSMIKNLLQV